MALLVRQKSLEITTLNSMLMFTGFNAKIAQSMPKGLETAEEVRVSENAVLIPKDMVLQHSHIGQLIRRKENSPDAEFNFILKKNKALFKLISERLKSDFKRVIETKKAKMEYRKLMERTQGVMDGYIDDMFQNEDLVYNIYRLYFIEKEIVKEGVVQHFNHLLSVVVFSIGIAIQSFQVSDKKFTKEDFVKIGLTALLHDFGGIESLADAAGKTIEVRKEEYFKANEHNAGTAAIFVKDNDIREAIKNTIEFYKGNRDYMGVEKISTNYANVVVTADTFDLMTSGLFESAMGPKEVTDKLYVKAQEKLLPKVYVDSLAKGLKFDALFDFYYELEKLIKWCPYGRSATPYPMTGFLSPTIVVCSKRVTKCPEFKGATESINIIRATSGLKEGSYGRCEKLSQDLVRYYDEFYGQIKEDVQSRQPDE